MQIELHAVREDYLQSSLLLKYEKFPIFLSLRAKANASLIQYVFLRFNVLERTISSYIDVIATCKSNFACKISIKI